MTNSSFCIIQINGSRCITAWKYQCDVPRCCVKPRRKKVHERTWGARGSLVSSWRDFDTQNRKARLNINCKVIYGFTSNPCLSCSAAAWTLQGILFISYHINTWILNSCRFHKMSGELCPDFCPLNNRLCSRACGRVWSGGCGGCEVRGVGRWRLYTLQRN